MLGKKLRLFLIILICTVFFAYLIASASGLEKKTAKIPAELAEKSINAPESSARVILKMKNTENKGFSAKTAQIKESAKTEELLKNKRILNRFGNSDIVAAEIPLSALDSIASDKNVEYIEEDAPVHAFLSESIPFIGANSVWSRQIAGINITGAGTTVCIIDTGVDYTHPDLGGCTNETFLAGNCSKVIGGYDFVKQ